jgi:diacylglycerol kinase (ATP)
MKKIAIIFNPKAGSGKKATLDRIIKKLSSTNKVELFETKAKGDATNISRKESDNFDIIIAAGGDGTIHEVVNGISNNTLLGIIPMGTANIVAIEAGITNNIDHICKIINEGVTKKIFTPTINNQKFILMAGIGYDAQVVNSINPKLKKIFGKFIFILEAFKQFFKLKDFNISVKVDGQTYKGNWVLVTNAKHYAGPFSITNSANIFNDVLVCYVFANLTKLNFLQSLWFIIANGDLSKSKHIVTLNSNILEINSSSPIPVQCDGESFIHTPVAIKNGKNFITMLTPHLK